MTQTYSPRPDSNRMREVREDDTLFEDDPRIARENAEARDRAEQASRESERPSEPRVDNGSGIGTSYLGKANTEEPWQQWRMIQADFVDNPREAVSKANGLVGELINGIVRQFEEERKGLEQRWSSGEDVSTEDLRRCLQTYRDFFGRLLANGSENKS